LEKVKLQAVPADRDKIEQTNIVASVREVNVRIAELMEFKRIFQYEMNRVNAEHDKKVSNNDFQQMILGLNDYSKKEDIIRLQRQFSEYTKLETFKSTQRRFELDFEGIDRKLNVMPLNSDLTNAVDHCKEFTLRTGEMYSRKSDCRTEYSELNKTIQSLGFDVKSNDEAVRKLK
jgi:hypothetical protein